jgi:hypothetical protein
MIRKEKKIELDFVFNLVIVMKNYNSFLMKEFLKKNNYYMKKKVLV